MSASGTENVDVGETQAGSPTSARRQDLTGNRVILTAQRRADEFALALRSRGAEVIHAPTLSHVPHVADPLVLEQTRRLVANPPDMVIVTTGVGFRGWMEAADAAGLATELVDALAGASIVARGPKARVALLREGLDATWTAGSETSDEIKAFLATQDLTGQRVAVQHHGAGSDGIDEALEALGAQVFSLIVYRWGPPPDPQAVQDAADLVARGDADCIAFTSAPGAQAFLDVAHETGVGGLVLQTLREQQVLSAAVGDLAAAPLRAAGISPLVPQRHRLGALIRTVSGALESRRAEPIPTPAGTLQITRHGAILGDRTIHLSPTSQTLLRRLAVEPGTVVSREDLLELLPEASGVHSVEVAIGRLRDALGARDTIQTVIKRGYRLAPTAGVSTPTSGCNTQT